MKILNSRKKILNIALIIGIYLSLSSIVFAGSLENCLGDCSHLVSIGTTHYDTLEEAI